MIIITNKGGYIKTILININEIPHAKNRNWLPANGRDLNTNQGNISKVMRDFFVFYDMIL